MSLDLKNSSDYRSDEQDQKLVDYFQDIQRDENEKYDHPQTKNVGKILHEWLAPEFEFYEKSFRWYLAAAILNISLIVYALFTDSPIMAITFILIGIVGYIHLQKEPRIITFAITSKGVLADKELYLFENIHSFWIFYEPPHTKTLSFHTKASMFPFVHMPLGDEDPVIIRELLLENIPEIRQHHGLVDTIEKVLHI